MIGEFGQLMLDILMGKNGFPGYSPFSTTVETAEYGKPPSGWVGELPSLHCYLDRMAGEDWTQNRPNDVARYIFEIRDRSQETGVLGSPAEQRVTAWADVLVETLRLDPTVQAITPYVHREETVMDYEERDNVQIPIARVHLRAELNSRAGIWGYSNWGQFVWGP